MKFKVGDIVTLTEMMPFYEEQVVRQTPAIIIGILTPHEVFYKRPLDDRGHVIRVKFINSENDRHLFYSSTLQLCPIYENQQKIKEILKVK